MIRVIVDSGSSIKQHEKETYNVDVMPLKILLGGREYLDGIDLTMDTFYHALIDDKQFPKTSLPAMPDELIERYLAEGDDVLILTISSGISGTYHTIKMHYENEPRVLVVDTKTAVGGIRILLREVNKMRNASLAEVERVLQSLIPRIRVIAIPETLDYLQRGGRLSRTAWAVGSLLQLKPLILLDSSDGRVKVLGKVRGKRHAMEKLASYLSDMECDEKYPIVPSYTYGRENLDQLIAMTEERYKPQMIEYDDLDPAIACHWGPNAFGYIFVSKRP